MKVESIRIQNFKRFKDLEVSFKNKILDEASDRYLVLGDNGGGKTTLLQAIALPLALATGRIQNISDFKWLGFLPGRYWQGKTPQIELEVSFEEEELATTREVARKWYDAQPEKFRAEQDFVQPGNSYNVKVVVNGNDCQIGNNPNEREQFKGRYYIQSLLKSNPANRSLPSELQKLPGIFCFDEFRKISYELRTDLYNDLFSWRMAQLLAPESYGAQCSKRLEKLYQKFFPDRSFKMERLANIDNEEGDYFVVDDGDRIYDIEEMSGGEQSIFLILYEFVKQQIYSSVVLIDEIDLNLHPPAAQFFVSQLSRIAPTCQFIFTTHSESVNNLIGESDTYRLPGGVLCL